MKKLAVFALTSLSVLAFSCGKKDKEVTPKLSATKTDIKYNETTQLGISVGSISDYTWKSSDEFVGTVDASGKFTANHMGETEITVTKAGFSDKIKMTVSPTETFFNEPIVEIGATKATIKSKEKRTLADEVDNALFYTDHSSSLRGGIIYAFDSNGKLTGVLVPMTETADNAKKVATFYAERYSIIGESDGIYFFSDRNRRYDLGIDPNDSDFGFVVAYFKYTDIGISSFLKSVKQQGGNTRLMQLLHK